MLANRDLPVFDMATDPTYRAAYETQADEFALVSALPAARTRAKLSEAEVGSRMGTTERVVSRLESGWVKPSTRTLKRYASATRHRLSIRLMPAEEAS